MDVSNLTSTARSQRAAALLLLGGVLGAMLLFAGPSAHADDSTLEEIPGLVLPSNVRPGETVTVHSTGWPAQAQVQAVLCGDAGLGGSGGCDLPHGALDRADEDGVVDLQLVVGAPPRPCPCVVRVSSFSVAAEPQNLPVNVIGHRVGTPPVETAEPLVPLVTEVRLEAGGGTFLRWLGLGGSARAVVVLRNDGAVDAPAPELEYGFGPGAAEATESFEPAVVVPSGESLEVSFEVDVPVGAIGSHELVVRAAGARAPERSGTWATYPWVLLVVVPLAVAALGTWAWLLRRRSRRARAGAAAAGAAAMSPSAYPLPEVVWVEELGGLLVDPGSRRGARLLGRVQARVSVADLSALADKPGTPDTPVEDAAKKVDEGQLSELMR